MSIEGPRVVAEPEPAAEVDTLDIGRPSSPRARRRLIALGAVAAVLIAGLPTWQWWPRPPGPLTFEELQGVYAGMVRSDGQNDAQPIRAGAEPDATLRPPGCQPLAALTGPGLLDGAADGMSTYWIEGGASTSLSTHRFVTASAAQSAFTDYQVTITSCLQTGIVVTADDETADLRLEPVVVAPLDETRQLGVELAFTPDERNQSRQVFTLRLVEFNNTISVLFRWDTGRRDPTTLREDRLAGSLVRQMEAVQAMRAH